MTKKKWLLSILAGIAAVIGGASGYESYSLQHTWNTIHTKHHLIPIDPPANQTGNTTTGSASNSSTGVKQSSNNFSLMLYGIGSHSMQNNSDTIMLAVIHPATKKINLISIPRDLYLNIPGATDHKLNAAYLIGGPNLAIRTIQDYTRIPIDGYMSVNFNGFLKIMQVLGGLTINVQQKIQFHDRLQNNRLVTIYPGKQHLTPMQVLEYARYRYGPDGTFGRAHRDQKVIKAVLNQSMQFRNITKIQQILRIAGNNFQTNLSLHQIGTFLSEFHSVTSSNIQSTPIIWHHLPGQKDTPSSIHATAGYLNKVSYVFLNQQNKTKLQKLLAKWMTEK